MPPRIAWYGQIVRSYFPPSASRRVYWASWRPAYSGSMPRLSAAAGLSRQRPLSTSSAETSVYGSG